MISVMLLPLRLLILLIGVAVSFTSLHAEPRTFQPILKSGPWKAGHVQGIAVDQKGGFIYYSFTTLLVKTDLRGKLIGTIEGFTGHLGDLVFNEEDRRLYGSLEYKEQQAFYIAIIDADRIDAVGMKAQHSTIFKTVYLPEVVMDYTADLNGDGRFDGNTADTPDHRYGCSGIDGVSFGPRFGQKNGSKNFLTVVYGIYANTSRTDNDHQVLLQYDATNWMTDFAQTLDESAPHRNGPARTDGKYFVYTGNTTYGVQNLAYDSYTKLWLMGVYKGVKPSFPNYTLFAVEADAVPEMKDLIGLNEKGILLPLAQKGLQDTATGIRGWHQKADVGMVPLGDGLFYLAVNHADQGMQSAEILLMRWTGDPARPFEKLLKHSH